MEFNENKSSAPNNEKKPVTREEMNENMAAYIRERNAFIQKYDLSWPERDIE